MLSPEEVRIVFDCGANIGITSDFFAAQYPNARIFSIEPDPRNFALLKRNVSQGRRIVQICRALVGSPREQVYLTTHAPAWGNSIAKSKTSVRVQASTIDEICEERGLLALICLNSIFEGAKKEVLANGRFLKWVNCGLVELHDNYDVEALKRDVSAWGFRVLEPSKERGLAMISVWPNSKSCAKDGADLL